MHRYPLDLPLDASGPQKPVAVWLVERLTGDGVPEAQRHPLSAKVFAAAAMYGDLPLQQLLRQRGCPWDRLAWEEAAKSGCATVAGVASAGAHRPARGVGPRAGGGAAAGREAVDADSGTAGGGVGGGGVAGAGGAQLVAAQALQLSGCGKQQR
jgi:hypothetical protein